MKRPAITRASRSIRPVAELAIFSFPGMTVSRGFYNSVGRLHDEILT